MNNAKVVAFVGMPGSGKSSCVEYLKGRGFPSVYLGGITVEEVKARGMEVNEANEKVVREDLRKTEGPGVMAERIIPKIEALIQEDHKVVIADGIYSWTEYKIFKNKFGDDVAVIAIASPRKIRHERLANRPERPLSENEITAREYAEIENIEKGGPIANADFTIVNDGTPDDLIQQIEKTLVAIGIE